MGVKIESVKMVPTGAFSVLFSSYPCKNCSQPLLPDVSNLWTQLRPLFAEEYIPYQNL